MVSYTIKTLVVIALIFIYNVGTNPGVGHLQPLGFQRKSEGHIEVTKEIPHPITFFNNYVKASKPIVFRGAAENLPAFSKWTDEYMKKTFGHIKVDVEEGKKENRSLEAWEWSFKDFLEKYQNEDVYMVNTLGVEMLKDLFLFPCLSCGGYTKTLQEVIMWLSSGGTKSVLHNDAVDNINCLFSGSKRLYMVDWRHREFINIDAPEGAFSNVNVDAVDLNKYPGFSKAPWWEANMESGDCLYIPYLWFHQVSSFTNNNRNMAVNTWFYHMKKINLSECEGNVGSTFKTPLDQLEFGNKDIESVRFVLLLQLENNTEMARKKMVESITEYHLPGEVTIDNWRSIIKLLDKNRDKKVTADELRRLTHEELKIISIAFPSLYKGDEVSEGDEDEDDDGRDEL